MENQKRFTIRLRLFCDCFLNALRSDCFTIRSTNFLKRSNAEMNVIPTEPQKKCLPQIPLPGTKSTLMGIAGMQCQNALRVRTQYPLFMAAFTTKVNSANSVFDESDSDNEVRSSFVFLRNNCYWLK